MLFCLCGSLVGVTYPGTNAGRSGDLYDIPVNIFGPFLTSLVSSFLSFLSSRPFDPLGGDRDGQRVLLGAREVRVMDVGRVEGVERLDDERLDDA